MTERVGEVKFIAKFQSAIVVLIVEGRFAIAGFLDDWRMSIADWANGHRIINHESAILNQYDNCQSKIRQ